MRATIRGAGILLLWAPVVSGCAGAMGEYGPGMTNMERTTAKGVNNIGGVEVAVGGDKYEAGDIGLGVQLGLRSGYVTARAGEVGRGGGLALDAHADFTASYNRFGLGLTGGYTADRVGIDGTSWFFAGFPVGAYGQFLITERLFVHLGGAYVVASKISQPDNDKVKGEVSAYRGSAGLTFVFARSKARDLAFRVEGRYTASSDADIGGAQIGWSSQGILAQFIWATF